MSRCPYKVAYVPCCLAKGHEGGHRYKCAGEFCPGLGWAASNTPHPTACVVEHLNRRTQQ